MVLQLKKIAVIGGGPGGLTVARLLQMARADVHVYERDINKDVRVQGATLDLHEESGLEALRRAQLIGAFTQNYRPNAGLMRITDKQGAIQFDDHTAGNNYAESRPEIDRGPLRKILLDSLEDGTVVWNSHFVGMEKQGNGWRLFFKNGTAAYADVVIGADGANSLVRPYITGIKPVYSGVTIVEGNVYHAALHAPQLWQLVKGGKVFALGNQQSLILSAKGDGSLSFYTGCKVPEDWVETSDIDFKNNQQVKAWFKQAFAGWGEIWKGLFETEELYCIPRPQYHYPLNQCWETLCNATLIGDAAHRMPPYAGEGVNMAMQDAFELAESFNAGSFTGIKEAIAYYEANMLQRASAVTADTLVSTQMLHSANAINDMLKLFSQRSE